MDFLELKTTIIYFFKVMNSSHIKLQIAAEMQQTWGRLNRKFPMWITELTQIEKKWTEA